MDIGSAVGRQQGLTDDKLAALQFSYDDPALSEVERAVLQYAVAMTQTPVEVADELFDELREHFNVRELVELTSCIAWENYRARFDHAFGVESEGFSEGAFCPRV